MQPWIVIRRIVINRCRKTKLFVSWALDFCQMQVRWISWWSGLSSGYNRKRCACVCLFGFMIIYQIKFKSFEKILQRSFILPVPVLMYLSVCIFSTPSNSTFWYIVPKVCRSWSNSWNSALFSIVFKISIISCISIIFTHSSAQQIYQIENLKFYFILEDGTHAAWFGGMWNCIISGHSNRRVEFYGWECSQRSRRLWWLWWYEKIMHYLIQNCQTPCMCYLTSSRIKCSRLIINDHFWFTILKRIFCFFFQAHGTGQGSTILDFLRLVVILRTNPPRSDTVASGVYRCGMNFY